MTSDMTNNVVLVWAVMLIITGLWCPSVRIMCKLAHNRAVHYVDWYTCNTRVTLILQRIEVYRQYHHHVFYLSTLMIVWIGCVWFWQKVQRMLISSFQKIPKDFNISHKNTFKNMRYLEAEQYERLIEPSI